MRKEDVDFSLYLVTDSTPEILGGRDLVEIVRAAIAGGVTIVQYRDKTSSHDVLVDTAKRLLAVTRAAGIPLLINDHVDVAKAVGCEGVHVGQDDTHITQAREALGPESIIGVSAGTIDEAIAACDAGADYLGIGTIFATNTKKDTKHILGPSGLSEILQALNAKGYGSVPTVCIGGINGSNAVKVITESAVDSQHNPHGNPVSGIAVVSVIIAAFDPQTAAQYLLQEIRGLPAESFRQPIIPKCDENATLKRLVPEVFKKMLSSPPIVHNMTNTVVQNFVANVLLAIGASPIMAPCGEEAADLARLGGALVVNIGTLMPQSVENQIIAIKAYNAASRPVIFDPVGAGATQLRRNTVKAILEAGKISVIKGNAAELSAVAAVSSALKSQQDAQKGSEEQQRGVDSTSTFDESGRISLVRSLAKAHRNVISMTGAADYVSDGTHTVVVRHGHELLGRVTGTGCAVGAVVGAMVSALDDGDDLGQKMFSNKLLAVVAGLVLFEVAAERAAKREDVRGPGTFAPAFLDELALCRKESGRGDDWIGEWKVEFV